MIRNLLGRTAALRALEANESMIWGVPEGVAPAKEMAQFTAIASVNGIKICQQSCITVSTKADAMPLQTLLITRIL